MTTVEELEKIKTSLYGLMDKFAEEVEEGAVKIVAPSATLADVRQLLDRWEELRFEVSKHHRKINRSLMDAQDKYQSGLRNAMGSHRRAKGLHYKEREAEYEIKNITTYQILRNLEKIEKDLSLFATSLNRRIFWLDARRLEMLTAQKQAQYQSSQEYNISS